MLCCCHLNKLRYSYDDRVFWRCEKGDAPYIFDGMVGPRSTVYIYFNKVFHARSTVCTQEVEWPSGMRRHSAFLPELRVFESLRWRCNHFVSSVYYGFFSHFRGTDTWSRRAQSSIKPLATDFQRFAQPFFHPVERHNWAFPEAFIFECSQEGPYELVRFRHVVVQMQCN